MVETQNLVYTNTTEEDIFVYFPVKSRFHDRLDSRVFSSSPLVEGKQWKLVQVFSLQPLVWDTTWSSWLLTSDCYNPAHCSDWGSEPIHASFLFFCITLWLCHSAFQQTKYFCNCQNWNHYKRLMVHKGSWLGYEWKPCSFYF